MTRIIQLIIIAFLFPPLIYAEGVPGTVIIPLEYCEGESSLAWDFFFPSEELSAISFDIDTEGEKPFISINFIDDKKEFFYSFGADSIKYDYQEVNLTYLRFRGLKIGSFTLQYYDKLLEFTFNDECYSLSISAGGNEFFEAVNAMYKNPVSSDRLAKLSSSTIKDTFEQLLSLLARAYIEGVSIQLIEDSNDEDQELLWLFDVFGS